MSTVKTPASEKKVTKKKTPSAAKKKLALEVIARLKKEYPETHCTLAYDKAWQLLVSVRLAAQCTDKRVDMVTPLLYEKFPTAAALAEAPVGEIEEIVRPCGLGPSKARDISKCMKMLQEEYGGKVPDTMEELLKLPLRSLRLSFTTESGPQTEQLLRAAGEILGPFLTDAGEAGEKAAVSGSGAIGHRRLPEQITRGHYRKGVE